MKSAPGFEPNPHKFNESMASPVIYKIPGITSTWPGNDNFSIRPPVSDEVRSFRLLATKTAGATAGAVVYYALDMPNEASAENMLGYVPSDPRIEPYPYGELIEDVWSQWVDLSMDIYNILPLQNAYFLASADTWAIKMEIA